MKRAGYLSPRSVADDAHGLRVRTRRRRRTSVLSLADCKPHRPVYIFSSPVAMHHAHPSSIASSTTTTSGCGALHLLRRTRSSIGFQSLTRRTMAAPPVSSNKPRRWFLLGCIFVCGLVSCCEPADEAAAAAAVHGQKRDAVDIVGRALFCFNDRYIYSGCQDSLRLGPQGALTVPPASTDAFCGGPCLAETELVLRCVDDVAGGFRFHNGASVGDVRLALGRGCLRGDFDVLPRLGSNYGDGYFYGGGGGSRRRPVSLVNTLPPLLLLSAGAAILLRG